MLLHEGQSWTMEALPMILSRMKEAGHDLVTVGDLLGVVALRSAPTRAKGRGAFRCSRKSTRLSRRDSSSKESAVFDGKVVRLRGARGETLGVQIRSRRTKRAW